MILRARAGIFPAEMVSFCRCDAATVYISTIVGLVSQTQRVLEIHLTVQKGVRHKIQFSLSCTSGNQVEHARVFFC